MKPVKTKISPVVTKTIATKTPIVKTIAANPVPKPAMKAPAAVPAKAPVVSPAPAPARVAVAAKPSATPTPVITSACIASRAYTIWEQRGRPSGNELENWLLAENQLKQEVQAFTA